MVTKLRTTGSDIGISPYVGPRPFSHRDQDKFFGRNQEVNQISSLVVANPVVLLYGSSGTGKSSLISAQLIPRFREREGFDVLIARVTGTVPQGILIDGLSNIFVFNAITNFRAERGEINQSPAESLLDCLHEMPHQVDDPDLPLLRILIFDQLEELFTHYPERWRDRKDFFHQVSVALDRDPLLRVIFALREDYLAKLDPFASLFREKLQVRFRLEQLRDKDALNAVVKPLEALSEGYHFAAGVAEAIVEDLLTVRGGREGEKGFKREFVEPVQLQVVCKSLWDSLEPGTHVITLAHLETGGSVDKALSRFYENVIHTAANEAGLNEGILRNWFERVLITTDGHRGVVLRNSTETAGIPDRALEELVNEHIIKSELRNGVLWYELSHDRLIKPIKDSNKHWLLAQPHNASVKQ